MMKLYTKNPLVTGLIALLAIAVADSDVNNQVNKTSSNEEDSFELDQFKRIVLDLKEMIKGQYLDDKFEGILNFIEEIRSFGSNFTLVGSENVYSENGDLKEVRTLELFLPQNFTHLRNEHSASFSQAVQDAFDQQQYIQMVSALGIGELDMVSQRLIDADRVLSQIYITGNLIAITEQNFTVVNQTAITVNTIEEAIKDFIKKTGGFNASFSSYLAFDKEGKLIKSKSTVHPEHFILVDVEPQESTGGEMLEATLKSLANTMLEAESLDKVHEQLHADLQRQYPDMKFVVINGSEEGSYMDRDFKIKLTYHYTKNPNMNEFKYTVCGKNIRRVV
ncbi:uncharacterized protein [Euwallacea fornicatus]|uniref:uncharacterized protein n=1 Tax=Euwallacea fornicatus TaxID=995702 RepID=UPI00338D42FB